MVDGEKVQKMIQYFNNNKKAMYMVTEVSRHRNSTYSVYKLNALLEDGEINFGDDKDVIYHEQYALMGFMVNTIEDIIFEDGVVNIMFEFNSIKIELLK